MQNAQAWNTENKFDPDENSLDIYNFDQNLDMGTIAELADAIDRSLNDTAICRTVLINQIKRSTRSIRRKYTNLQQDLVNVRWDRDMYRQERDQALLNLQQLRTNAQNQVNRMTNNIARKRMRIGELLCENFAFQLLYQRNAHHLQQCRADRGLLEYNRDRLYERYEKWKNKAHVERQNILNLNQQILALHNNPPNQINMADARRLPIVKLMAPALAKFQPYTGQEPPDDYLDKVIQSWAYLEGHMTVLENANAGDFDNAIKYNILKSMMGGKYALVPANNGLVVGNPAINSPDILRA